MFRVFESSQHARLYARHRPDPPAALVSRVVDFVRRSAPLERAVDVGCGSGQNTRLLAPHFTAVLATDISPAQIAEAAAHSSARDNVRYEVAPAEEIPAPDGSVHLVTASMCYHFFDRPRFLAEADRVLAPGGVNALYGYSRPARLAGGRVWTEFDDVVNDVRDVRLGEYWPLPARDVVGVTKEAMRLIRYSDVLWDEESYVHKRPLSVDLVMGDIGSWSSFQNMAKSCGAERGDALLKQVREELLTVVADGEKMGINMADVTEQRKCFLMLARKPTAAGAAV